MTQILNMVPVYPQTGGMITDIPGEPLGAVAGCGGGVDNLVFILYVQGPFTRVRLVPAGGTVQDNEVYIGGICLFNHPYALVKVM